MKLLDGQDFYHALASYYELAFVFQLKYSRRCQTTAHLIQLKVLQYGDQELGSLTGQKKYNKSSSQLFLAILVLRIFIAMKCFFNQ